MTARSWTIDADFGRPLTVNAVASLHRMKWATRTAETRRAWTILAAAHKVQPCEKVAVTVTPLHKNRRAPQDPAACAPEAKGAIDGLVDAGLIPDDTGAHVASVTFLPPVVCGTDGLRIHIEEVES